MAGFTVPRKTQQVAPTALPAARQISPAGRGDFGELEAEVTGRVGQQVERLGEVALAAEKRERIAEAKKAKIEAQFKKETDKLFANDAIIKYQDWWRNQEPTYTTKTGLDAKGVSELANQDIEKKRKELQDKLDNPEKIKFFDAKFAAERDSGLNVVHGHETSEHIKTREAQTDAIIENSISGAAASVDKINEEGTIFRMTLNLEDAIAEKVSGLPKAAAKNVSDTLWSAFHEAILNRKVALNAVAAQQYYDKHKGAILPKNREGIEKILEIKLVDQESTETTNFITLQEEDPVKQTKLMLDMPDKTPHDEAVKKETRTKLKQKQDDLKQLKVEEKGRVLDNALGNIKLAESREKAQEIINDTIANNIDITNKEIDQLEGYADAREKEKTGKVITDPVVEERVNRMVTQGKIKTVEHYTRETGGKMSNEDLQKAGDFIAKGGRVGDLSEGTLRTKFNGIMFMQPKEDPYLYKLARDYVVDQIKLSGLAPTPTNVDQWMGEALISGFETETLDKLFKLDQDITLIEALKRGIPFTTEITEDEKKSIVDDIIEENATRTPIERININDENIEIIFLRQEGLTEEQINEVMTLGVR